MNSFMRGNKDYFIKISELECRSGLQFYSGFGKQII